MPSRDKGWTIRHLLRIPRQGRNCRGIGNRGRDATSRLLVPALAVRSHKCFPDEAVCFAPGKPHHQNGVCGDQLEQGAPALFRLNIRLIAFHDAVSWIVASRDVCLHSAARARKRNAVGRSCGSDRKSETSARANKSRVSPMGAPSNHARTRQAVGSRPSIKIHPAIEMHSS